MDQQEAEVKQVVVLGAGNWVKEQYAKALRPYQERQEREKCNVFFIYNTIYASTRGRLTKRQINRYNRSTLENVKEFESWGATCLNLADPTNQARIRGIAPYAVFVVTPDDTHCDNVEEWLDRAQNIIVEKPFDVDHERIRKLRSGIDEGTTFIITEKTLQGLNLENIPDDVLARLESLKDQPHKGRLNFEPILTRAMGHSGYNSRILKHCERWPQVWGFDHYLVRANQFKKMRDYLRFDEHMEKQIYQFRFHMLESSDRGMAERIASIQRGMLMDMGSHIPAMVLPFGDPNTIRLESVRAGIYEANPAEEITISGRTIMKDGLETFAKVKFTFTSVFGQIVEGTACVGKCVGKSDEKHVEVTGGSRGDRRVVMDLSNFVVDFSGGNNPGPVTPLFPNPVYLLVREVIEGRHSDTLALFDPGAGQDIVARLNEWRRPVLNRVRPQGQPKLGSKLKGYAARAPLQDIIADLDPI